MLMLAQLGSFFLQLYLYLVPCRLSLIDLPVRLAVSRVDSAREDKVRGVPFLVMVNSISSPGAML